MDYCNNCKYAHVNQGPWDAMAGQHIEIYFCRRYPPQLIATIENTAQGPAQAVRSMYPQMTAESYCGEHVPGTPSAEPAPQSPPAIQS